MLHQSPESFGETFALTHPASHWTGPVKVRFLDYLSRRGNVRLAARQVGLSAETAYRQRRRDPLFARAWSAAMALARDRSEQILADRAIDGIEETVWHRGEVVGTRVRYDTRLLLAHLARLDKRVSEDAAAEADAGRFDELLAVIVGEETDLAPPGSDPLPPQREALAREAAECAAEMVDEAFAADEDENGYIDDEADERYRAEIAEAEADARAGVHARYDAWLARAHRAVDGVLDPAPVKPAQAWPDPDHSSSEPRQQCQHPVGRPGDGAPCDREEMPPD